VVVKGGMQDGTQDRLGRVWKGILGLYRARPDTGSAGAELVGLAFAAEDLLVQGKAAPAVEALSRAEELLQDLGVGMNGTAGEAGGDGVRGLPEAEGGGA
jgi:hypothetical protein